MFQFKTIISSSVSNMYVRPLIKLHLHMPEILQYWIEAIFENEYNAIGIVGILKNVYYAPDL